MGEKNDHWRMKQQIRDFLKNEGWEATTEQRFELLTHNQASPYTPNHIIVDVFAAKNSKTYICEIGSLHGGLKRLNFLKDTFDIVEHLHLNRPTEYYSRPSDFSEVYGVRFNPKKPVKDSLNKNGILPIEVKR